MDLSIIRVNHFFTSDFDDRRTLSLVGQEKEKSFALSKKTNTEKVIVKNTYLNKKFFVEARAGKV